MIEFSCLKCGRTMKVADTVAGKKGQCKNCGAAVTVPTPDNAGAKPQPPLVVFQALTKPESKDSEPKRNIPVAFLTRMWDWLSHSVGVKGTLRPKPCGTECGFDSHQIMAARVAAAGILLVAISPFFRLVSAGRMSVLMIQHSIGRELLISAVIAAVLYMLAMVSFIRRVPTLFVVQSWGILVGFQMGAKIWHISQLDLMPPPDNLFALMVVQQFTFSPGLGLYIGLIGGFSVALSVGFVLFRQLRSDSRVALVYAIPCLACISGVFIVDSIVRINDDFRNHQTLMLLAVSIAMKDSTRNGMTGLLLLASVPRLVL